ncbi:hypothetical protein THAOC_18224, partial [Thalassiosira oceanica]
MSFCANAMLNPTRWPSGSVSARTPSQSKRIASSLLAARDDDDGDDEVASGLRMRPLRSAKPAADGRRRVRSAVAFVIPVLETYQGWADWADSRYGDLPSSASVRLSLSQPQHVGEVGSCGCSQFTMTRTCGSAKRQRVASFESALANVDVVSQLAAFLEAADLCHVKASCKALGSANDKASVNGLSVTEEAARRIFEGASDEEKAMLPRYDGESWIVLYHHLLMLRTRLTFDQLIGNDVEYHGGDKDAVQGISRYGFGLSICGEHIMRAGKHWAT